MRTIKEPHLFDPKKIEVLEQEGRKTWQNPNEILEKVEIYPDFIAADIGCGSGVFTIPLAHKVKKVYAIDVQKEMLDFLETKIKKYHLKNIELKVAAENEIPLADENVDLLISINTLHEFDDKDQMVKEMFRVLKPNGNALISDFQKKETDFGPPVFIRLSKNDAITLFERNGFTTLQTHQLVYHYLLVFSKQTPPP
ncbi:MAG: class I SAM-dependent methyltransferase [Promethearchaeota archaeon]